MLDRIVVGTANWGREYNGHCVDEKEQNLIMEYMKEVGIEWLDVATAYGTENVGLAFNRIVKVNRSDTYQRLCLLEEKRTDGLRDVLMAHDEASFFDMAGRFKISGVSVYAKDNQLATTAEYQRKWIELPYSVMDNSLPSELITNRLIARSIFCKGKALKYFSPRECLDFVLMNPKIDKVIIGVDSVDQLKDNVGHLVNWTHFTHEEEVDTRKF